MTNLKFCHFQHIKIDIFCVTLTTLFIKQLMAVHILGIFLRLNDNKILENNLLSKLILNP
jgi:hypothetical protein